IILGYLFDTHTNSQTHTHTHTHTHSHTLYHTHKLTNTHSHTLYPTHKLTNTRTHTLYHSQTHMQIQPDTDNSIHTQHTQRDTHMQCTHSQWWKQLQTQIETQIDRLL